MSFVIIPVPTPQEIDRADVEFRREAAERNKQMLELMAKLDADAKKTKAIMARAIRITDRLLPALPSANGFYDPEGFISGSRRRGLREYLRWIVYAMLRSKIERGAPFIEMPRDASSLRDTAIHRASRALAENHLQAWIDACAMIKQERNGNVGN